jgi:hypothetical protein
MLYPVLVEAEDEGLEPPFQLPIKEATDLRSIIEASLLKIYGVCRAPGYSQWQRQSMTVVFWNLCHHLQLPVPRKRLSDDIVALWGAILEPHFFNQVCSIYIAIILLACLS